MFRDEERIIPQEDFKIPSRSELKSRLSLARSKAINVTKEIEEVIRFANNKDASNKDVFSKLAGLHRCTDSVRWAIKGDDIIGTWDDIIEAIKKMGVSVKLAGGQTGEEFVYIEKGLMTTFPNGGVLIGDPKKQVAVVQFMLRKQYVDDWGEPYYGYVDDVEAAMYVMALGLEDV